MLDTYNNFLYYHNSYFIILYNKMKKCPSGTELVGKKCLKKCQPNQIRNPKTNRCKIKKGTPPLSPVNKKESGPFMTANDFSPKPLKAPPSRPLPPTRKSPTKADSPILIKTTLEQTLEFVKKHNYNFYDQDILMKVGVINTLPKNSASESVQALVDVEKLKGVIKVWSTGTSCLGAEYLIYKYITPYLYYNKVCPNVLIPIQVGTTKKRDFEKYMTDTQYKKLLHNKNVTYIVTPYFKSHLEGFLNKINYKKHLSFIIFTIMFNIAGYTRIGLKHNDLHKQNIRINELKEPIKTFYKVGSNYISTTSNLELVIFDFDRAGLDNPGFLSLVLRVGDDHGVQLVLDKNIPKDAKIYSYENVSESSFKKFANDFYR
jgi:hypothetical protein